MDLPEVLIRPDLGYKAYRLRCRFIMDAYPLSDWVTKTKFKVAEMFVADMAKQGWEYDPNKLPVHERGFKLAGPFPQTPDITNIKVPRRYSGKQALLMVAAGNRLHDEGQDYAVTLPTIDISEKWEYELSAVFIHKTILTEIPDSHEEHEVNSKK